MPDPRTNLPRVLNPRTIAVVGDKRANGYLWLRNMSTFQGKLYSVQIDPAEIPGIEELGVPNYPSLADVPGEIDYVVCAVPRAIAPRIIADCAAKGVGGVALFTSGFAETGEDEGVRLQAEIGRIAREAGLALIGPNCMGVYNPKLGVRRRLSSPRARPGRSASSRSLARTRSTSASSAPPRACASAPRSAWATPRSSTCPIMSTT